jgi:hypothetical protein
MQTTCYTPPVLATPGSDEPVPGCFKMGLWFEWIESAALLPYCQSLPDLQAAPPHAREAITANHTKEDRFKEDAS